MRQSRSFARFTSVFDLSSLDEDSATVLRGEGFPGSVPLTAHSPLALDDPERMWVVVAGEVDLFHERHRGDPLRASRRYVGTLWAGEVVVGGQSNAEGDDGVLVAVGYGEARLEPVPRRLLDDTAPEHARVIRALAVGAAETMGRAMHRVSRSAARPLSLAERREEVPAGTAVTSLGPVVWVTIADGGLRFGGEIPLSGDVRHFPLPRGMWLTSESGGATLMLTDIHTVCAGGQMADRIAHAWMIFRIWLARCAAAEEGSERARLSRRIDGERARHARAIASLSELLQGRGELPPLEATGDPLMDACALVGGARGIAWRPVPDAARGAAARGSDAHDPHRDAVLALCNAARVRYRRLTLRAEWWRHDAGAMLAFRGESFAPVALLVEPAGGYVMMDPETGERLRVSAAVAATLSPLAYTFYRPFPNGELRLRDLARMLGSEVGGDLQRVLGYVGAGALLGLSLPIVTGILFNQVIPSAAMSNAVTLFATLLAVAGATALVDVGRAFALIRVETRSTLTIQAAMVDRLLALPPQFFREYPVGDLAMRAEAVSTAREALTGAAVTSLFGVALVFSSLGLMLWYSAPLALLAVAVLAVSALVTAAAGLYALPHERRRQSLLGGLHTLVFELLSGIAKLHVAAAERRMFALWGTKFRALKIAAFKVGTASAALTVFNGVLPVVAAAGVFLVASKMLLTPGGIRPGDFIAFNAAFGGALAAGIGVSTTLVSLLNLLPLFERAAPILETPPEVDDAKPDPGGLSGRIEVAQLTFGYIAGAPPILDDISFQVRPGEFIAFVGPSGSGKSTILRLLLGFERPARGAVYYDGHDLASVDVGAIRRQCAVVLQHSKLLAGDIFTNIVGASPLTHEDAWRAAELAGLADDIRAMPMGMFTVISEGGSTLSGGQRQRLLIARALVRNPRVVLFDEATSALDNRSQEVVTQSLEGMDATRIVIAHRLTTVQRADRIFVMERGRIVQQGSYGELVSAPGLFQDLARRQLV